MSFAGMKEAFRDRCPSLDQLTVLFEKQLTPAESHVVEEHLHSCATCKAEWDMLVDFHTSASLPGEAQDVEKITKSLKASRATARPSLFSMPWVPRLAGAFALLAIVIAVTVPWRGQKAPELSGGDSGILRSGVVMDVSPRGDLSQLPSELTWKPVAEAASYDVVVSEVDRTVVWRGRTASTTLPLPAAVKASLTPGKPVLYQVGAVDKSGNRIGQSDQVLIRYKP